MTQERTNTRRVGLRSGVQIGCYTIKRQIACRGHRVFEAEHSQLHYRVAFKVLSEERAEGVVREVATLAQLSSPYIPRLLDAGRLPDRVGGHPYLVTEFLGTQNLHQLLQAQRRLEPLRAVRLTLQVLEALTVVHAQGLVHGDIKPSNVMVVSGDELERAVLVDYGAAQHLGVDGAGLTTPTMVTPAYAAPEILAGEGYGTSADIYSVASMLYECIAGAAPSSRDDEASLSELVPVSPHLVQVIAQGRAVARACRFATSKDFADALLGIDYDAVARQDVVSVVSTLRHQEAADTVPVGADSFRRVGPSSTAGSGEYVNLRSTGQPEIWVLTGDSVFEHGPIKTALSSLGAKHRVMFLDSRERERVEELLAHGGEPPSVLVFADIHVLLREPLLERMAQQGETSRLLVTANGGAGFLSTVVNACGLHAVIGASSESAEVEREIERLIERASSSRRSYDGLRLALRDAEADLLRLRQGLALEG